MTRNVRAQDIADFCETEFGCRTPQLLQDFDVLAPCTLSNLRAFRVAFSSAPASGERLEVPDDSILLAPIGAKGGPGIILNVDNPRMAFGQIVKEFFVVEPPSSVHPTAVIDPSASVDPSASIGAYCIIGPDCVVGENSVIHHHVVLARNVRIGKGCVIWSHAVLGEDGFAIERGITGNLERLPHVGGVEIGNFVHIGNGTAIAGGTIDPTIVGDHSMIDNLVHIAHNVSIGKNCQVIACAEVSGSVRIGDDVIIAPNASIIQKKTIGNGAIVGIGSCVIRDVDPESVVAGVPAKSIRGIDDNAR